MKKKVTSSEVKTTVNIETGEIIEEINTKTFAIEKEPEYVKLYIHDIARLNDLGTGKEKILYEFVRSMGYNNIIPAYMPIKKIMASNLGISVNYINKCIDEFYKKGIFIRLARGVYIADPELFARGKWEDIKNLRLVIDYKANGTKTLKSNISEQMKTKLNM